MQSDDLKDAGLKATQPRLKILSTLEQNRERHNERRGRLPGADGHR